jgi:predicted 3-demethylubiquinone-9 3-methyltransferase (glyoxalase superfamily)
MQAISPFLWFDTQAEEAAEFYASRTMQAMMKMSKIDTAVLQAAHDGV